MRGARSALHACTLAAIGVLLAASPALARDDVYETLELVNPLVGPSDVVVDRRGNVYVLGAGSQNVFQINPSGVVRVVFDPAAEGIADLVGGLHALAVDASGSVYVTASSTDNALRVFPKPVVEILRASGDGEGHSLRAPTGIRADPRSSDVYVVGSVSENVFRVTPGGRVTRILGRRGDGASPCLRPVDVAVDGAQNVYVACEASNNVFWIAPTGAVRQVLSEAVLAALAMARPRRLVTDGLGRVYVGTSAGVVAVARSGAVAEIVPSASRLAVGGVAGLAVDSKSHVYVSFSGGDGVYRIDGSGTAFLIANGTGDGAHPLVAPGALAVDAAGDVYVAGRRSNNVFRVSRKGGVSQVLDASGDSSWLYERWPLRRWPHRRR